MTINKFSTGSAPAKLYNKTSFSSGFSSNITVDITSDTDSISFQKPARKPILPRIKNQANNLLLCAALIWSKILRGILKSGAFVCDTARGVKDKVCGVFSNLIHKK